MTAGGFFRKSYLNKDSWRKDEEDDMLNNIKGIILNSLIDIPRALKIYLRDTFDKYFAEQAKEVPTNTIGDMLENLDLEKKEK